MGIFHDTEGLDVADVLALVPGVGMGQRREREQRNGCRDESCAEKHAPNLLVG